LSDCNVQKRFVLMDTEASDKILLDRAEIRDLTLIGCDLKEGLSARGAVIKGGVMFHGPDISSTASKFYGPVTFAFARISGQLDCCGSLMADKGRSLDIQCAKIEGSIMLRSGFVARGPIRLNSAVIDGDLNCYGGSLKDLHCERVTIGGCVFFSEGFNAEGEIKLANSRMGGDLDCRGGSVHDLSCDRANVGGTIVIGHGFRATGDVTLRWAQVGAQLDGCSGEMHSLDCRGAKIGGDVLLRNGCTVQTFIDLTDTEIDGNLSFSSGSFNEVRCWYTNVMGDMHWTSLQGVSNTELWLVGANVRTLFDDQESWPTKGKLHLCGFTYRDLSNRSGVGAGAKYFANRIDWLCRQPSDELLLPQPWTELSSLALAKGDKSSARSVVLRIHCLQARISGLPIDPASAHIHRLQRELDAANTRGLTLGEAFDQIFASLPKRSLFLVFLAFPVVLLMRILRLGEWIAKLLFAFLRHQPLLIIIPIVVATLVGSSVFHHAEETRTMAPAEPRAYADYTRGATDQGATTGYQRFSPTVYALENILPLARLGQTDKWSPDPDPKHGRRGKLTSYAFLSTFRWTLVLIGYALATILATAIAGKFRD
jgi:hypothetical protein